MHAVKCVAQNFTPSLAIIELQDNFKWMINEAIRRGNEAGISSKFKLIKLVYRDLKIGLQTHFINTACESAASILKRYRSEKRKNPNTKFPHVRHGFVSIDSQSYTIKNCNTLRFAIKPRYFVAFALNNHTVNILSQPNLKLGSVVLTRNRIFINYSKEIPEVQAKGLIGIDRSLFSDNYFAGW